jgi:hypothetical protein
MLAGRSRSGFDWAHSDRGIRELDPGGRGGQRVQGPCCAFWQINFASKTPQSDRRPARGFLKYRSRPAACRYSTKTILLKSRPPAVPCQGFAKTGQSYCRSAAVCPPPTETLSARTRRTKAGADPWPSGAGGLSAVWLGRFVEGHHVGNCETGLFFAFVRPIFRLVNEPASRLTLIGSGRADRAGATNPRRAVRP